MRSSVKLPFQYDSKEDADAVIDALIQASYEEASWYRYGNGALRADLIESISYWTRKVRTPE